MPQYMLMSNLAYEGIDKDLRPEVDAVLDKWAKIALRLVQAQWTNWVAGTGRSRAAWTVRVQDGVIVLENPLGYVAYVHKAGERGTFVEVVMARVTAHVQREMWDDLTKLIEKAMIPDVTGEIEL